MSEAGDVVAVHVAIEGRVQGVGYRAWCLGRARASGLSGWVRNRRTGAVEAVFSGPRSAVEAMIAHCKDGPPGAVVSEVRRLRDTDPVAGGFDIAPTV